MELEFSDHDSPNINVERTPARQVKQRRVEVEESVPVDSDSVSSGEDSDGSEESEDQWAWSSLEEGSEDEIDLPAAAPLVYEEHVWEEQTEAGAVKEALSIWYNQSSIPLASLQSLLRTLGPFFPLLPVDARTVVGKISNKPTIRLVPGGEFCSLGLINQLSVALARCRPEEPVVYLNLHNDGIPLFKSSKTELIPILFTMQHAVSLLPPTVVCLFIGKKKPPLKVYLKEFACELKALLRDGIMLGGVQYEVKVRSFICDTPARAYIKGVKGHAGYYSCEHCTQEGFSFSRGLMVFPEMDAPPRTDASFLARDQPEHHNETSPLEDTGLGMVSQFPLDYMHLVLLGVVRRLLFMWAKFKKPHRLGTGALRLLNAALSAAHDWWPSDFNRKPRSTEEVKYWKATEYRSFILYLSPSVLKQSLISNDYRSYMYLHAAITILCRKDLCCEDRMLDRAQEYLRKFVIAMRTRYSERILFTNFHNLLHLTDVARKYGALDGVSAFPFENFLQALQKLVTSTRFPMVSLVNRLVNQSNGGFVPGGKGWSPPSGERDGPVKTSLLRRAEPCNVEGAQYRKYQWHGTILSTRQGDNVVYLTSGKVLVIQRIVCSSAGHYLVGRKFRQKIDAYQFPCRSSDFSIFRVSELAARAVSVEIAAVRCKAVVVPYKGRPGEFVSFPLRLKQD